MSNVLYELSGVHHDEIVCPHCNHEHTDSWEWADGKDGHFDGYTCHACEKRFSFERHVTVTYTTRRAQ